MANVFDQFDEPPSPGPAQANPFDRYDPNTGLDALFSLGIGGVKGVIATAGMPGDVRELLHLGADALAKRLNVSPERAAELKRNFVLGMRLNPVTAPIAGIVGEGPTSKQVRGAVEEVTGPLYEPKTKLGKAAETVGEFIPGAVAGPGGIVRNAIRYGVAPGVAAATAGHVTQGTEYEPYAKAAAAITAMIGGHALMRGAPAKETIAAQLARDVTPTEMAAAEKLIQESKVALTWPEALSQVTGRPVLTDVQRLLESTAKTRPTMQAFMADRAPQVEAAVREEANLIAPLNQQPSTIGPAVGRAADQTVGDIRKAINDFTDPFYQRAAAVQLTPSEMAQVRALPGYDEAARAVRADPQLNRYVSHLPEDSVGFLNEVKKYLDQAKQNATLPTQQNPNMQRAAGYGLDAEAVRRVAQNASPDYATALGVQTFAREKYLDPLLQGPLGKLADKDITTKNAIATLFPANPIAGSADEVSTAVSALAKRNRLAASQLVRAHVESVFNEAAQNLRSGPNLYGGSNFAAAIAGNAQQRANLKAAIEALGPAGPERWKGFERLLETLEATGKRQELGSKTTFNTQELEALKTGGGLETTARVVGSPAKWWSLANDKWGEWRLGRNLSELAQIITDPRSARLLTQLAGAPSGSRQAQILAARIIAQNIKLAQPTTAQPQSQK